MSNYLPYTYLIGWSKQDLWYYGCQYGCSAHPSNLWTSYFTSSKTLHQLRATLGEPDVIQVRRTFTTALAALEWESRVLKRMNATFSPRWINKHNGNTQFNVLDSDRWATQKSREDQSTLMSSLWQDPAFREAWSTKQNERWNSTDRVVDAEEKRDRLARESHSSAIKKGMMPFGRIRKIRRSIVISYENAIARIGKNILFSQMVVPLNQNMNVLIFMTGR